ncbi:methyltransferase type 11 [Putridiphycobacter roseus]|uniref:Methyltransferase type 11 n=1 Tax=Putridiphycobacter roseus TaxID=2219161 RepID=A0A2W1MZW8_9FLAO|nr:methyltransferase [Putridiphycobacter roseus]PZE17779.1 methyltransferase type 11 [Putridiphycobacter roseus]
MAVPNQIPEGIKDLILHKPICVEIGKDIRLLKANTDFELAIASLENGHQIMITGNYSNGLGLLKELQEHLSKKLPNKTFLEQRAYRNAFRTLSNLILIEIKNHQLHAKKAPIIGWFEKLYPNTKNFVLPFPQVQGLNSAWQWYLNGVTVPVLRNKLHPYYGTYFPTRFDHLILFDNWLKRYEGPKKTAIDIGVGSGVLAFQMIKHGFQKVFGTDTNPNAIVGLKEFMGTTKLSRKLELDFGHLFGRFEKQTELIVFNPPWIPESHELESIDQAIYYDQNLFPDFFKNAKERLLPDGKLLVIFSNLAQITHVTEIHPIAEELANGKRFKLEKCLKRAVKAASDKTKRDQNWRENEAVELWVLTHNDLKTL